MRIQDSAHHLYGASLSEPRIHEGQEAVYMYILVVMTIICAGRAFAKVTRKHTGTHAHMGLVPH